jgi:hypothetical protein
MGSSSRLGPTFAMFKLSIHDLLIALPAPECSPIN